MAKLGDICTINMGQSPESSSYNTIGEGLPFFQGNADFGDIHPTIRTWCSNPIKIAKKGDLLISVRAPIGALNIANNQCCIGRGLAALTNYTKNIYKDYLWFALLSKINELNSKGTGSTFKAINKKILAETDISLPSLEKQKQIAKQLICLNTLLLKRKQQLSKLDQLVKSRFIEMFGEIIKNDRNWPTFQLSEIADSRLGKMLDSKQQTGTSSFYYLANFNVQWFSIDTSKLNKMDFDIKDQLEFQLHDGDVLVCEGGEIGRCAVWHNQISPCFFQKALHRIRCKKNFILPDYLTWWFKFNSENKAFENIAGAKATIAHLPGVKLKKLLIATPPIHLQEEFASFVQQVDKVKSSVKQSLETLETLKKSLMQKYFG